MTATTAQATPAGEQRQVAFRLQSVARNDSDHQSNADGNRESHGQSSHVDARNQQQVGEIENGSCHQHVHDIRAVGRVNIIQKTCGIARRGASHGESEDERNQKYSQGIVPIEELKAIILYPLKVLAQEPQQTALVIIINSAISRLCGVYMGSPWCWSATCP